MNDEKGWDDEIMTEREYRWELSSGGRVVGGGRLAEGDRLVLGPTGQRRDTGFVTLPWHVRLTVAGGRLLVASTDARAPATAGTSAVPHVFVGIELPCQLVTGNVEVRLFAARRCSSLPKLPAQLDDDTIAQPSPPLPPPASPPPRRTLASASAAAATVASAAAAVGAEGSMMTRHSPLPTAKSGATRLPSRAAPHVPPQAQPHVPPQAPPHVPPQAQLAPPDLRETRAASPIAPPPRRPAAPAASAAGSPALSPLASRPDDLDGSQPPPTRFAPAELGPSYPRGASASRPAAARPASPGAPSSGTNLHGYVDAYAASPQAAPPRAADARGGALSPYPARPPFGALSPFRAQAASGALPPYAPPPFGAQPHHVAQAPYAAPAPHRPSTQVATPYGPLGSGSPPHAPGHTPAPPGQAPSPWPSHASAARPSPAEAFTPYEAQGVVRTVPPAPPAPPLHTPAPSTSVRTQPATHRPRGVLGRALAKRPRPVVFAAGGACLLVALALVAFGRTRPPVASAHPARTASTVARSPAPPGSAVAPAAPQRVGAATSDTATPPNKPGDSVLANGSRVGAATSAASGAKDVLPAPPPTGLPPSGPSASTPAPRRTANRTAAAVRDAAAERRIARLLVAGDATAANAEAEALAAAHPDVPEYRTMRRALRRMNAGPALE